MNFSKEQQITIGARFLAIKNLGQTHVFKLPILSYDDYKKGHSSFMHMIENDEMHAGLIAKTRHWSGLLREKNKLCWEVLRKEAPFLFE